MCGGRGYMAISVASDPFCCKTKTALKNKIH